ncbi:Abi family protein [Corallibacter vietnamensis]|uniref:Abi family protein n=1 Tax=Corallibacter vietnamensis TaxID=904130 RepID=A0ABP7GSN5_9FLAO
MVIYFIPIPLKIYNKPPLTYQEQLDRLKERGLIVNNEAKAIHLLENLSYYRISGYLYPMLTDNKEDHEFKKGSTFENAFKMYCFDRELKQLIYSDIEKIEVSFRAKLTYVLSHKYNAFWYTYEGLFKNRDKHLKSLETTYKMVSDSTEDFAIKYRKRYVNTYQPSWMALEIVTFTHLSVVYENLKDTAAKSEISEHYGVPYQLLENWLKILTYTRNICAHHSRFWNRNLSLPIKKSTKELPFNWIEQTDIPRNKSYIYLSAIKYLLDRVNPKNTFTERLTVLFEKYNNIDIHKGMSFPEDWKEQPLWKLDLSK